MQKTSKIKKPSKNGNMKIIAIGDIHGKNIWEEIVKQNKDANLIIFLGDYFDSFNIPYQEQMINFKNILKLKSENTKKVILLLGNHDYQYLPLTKERYSGYQHKYKTEIQHALLKAFNSMQICFKYENFIFTHAGITKTWAEKNKIDLNNISDSINTAFEKNQHIFRFTPSNPLDNTGDSITQSPLWVRPRALLSNNLQEFKQIVGHTHHEKIKLDKEVIFIDILDNKNEYLIINNSQLKISEIK